MKVQLHNPVTGKTRTMHAHLTTDHSTSSYGQPVMIAGGEPLDVANAILQGARIIAPPKRADQVRMLLQWQKMACAMAGLRHVSETRTE
jgi:hypothetical protein